MPTGLRARPLPMRGKTLVFAMCAGQVGNLLPHVVVPAVMVGHLIPLWGLSNAQAGLLAAAYAAGYMLTVPVLSALTDRIDARRLLLAGSLASSIATIAFGLLAQDLWTAMLLWALAGAGFAAYSRLVPISILVIVLLVIVVTSYRQTIFA